MKRAFLLVASLAQTLLFSATVEPNLRDFNKTADRMNEASRSEAIKKAREQAEEAERREVEQLHRIAPRGDRVSKPQPNDPSLTKEMNSLKPDLQSCHDTVPAEMRPSEVRVAFQVTSDGAVEGERILLEGGPTPVPALYECLLSKLKAHRFPTGASGRKAPNVLIRFVE